MRTKSRIQDSEFRIQKCMVDTAEVVPAETEQPYRNPISLQRAVFLDRDGVINKKLEGDYVKSYDEFSFLPGVIDAIKKIKQKGLMVIIITNQSGIGRGIMSEDDLINVHEQMLAELKKNGVTIDAIYYCPHSPDNGCDCRKPKDGLFKQALMDFNIDMRNSWMIGDEQKDVEAGEKAGCQTYLLSKGELLIKAIELLL
ncbi:MAG: D-glycero-beta-D-manno-heptose 1,7-bisphosphate 7-phosphatase [bacterium]|nr:D-glycero-beta-D-manno-heptose 1,7-bisphosphate 7-phosphatase [bacterium]